VPVPLRVASGQDGPSLRGLPPRCSADPPLPEEPVPSVAETEYPLWQSALSLPTVPCRYRQDVPHLLLPRPVPTIQIGEVTNGARPQSAAVTSYTGSGVIMTQPGPFHRRSLSELRRLARKCPLFHRTSAQGRWKQRACFSVGFDGVFRGTGQPILRVTAPRRLGPLPRTRLCRPGHRS